MAANPSTLVVSKPSSQSVYFGGKLINLTEIGRSKGISVSYLSRIFRGERMPTLPFIRKISSALGMEVQEFLDMWDYETKQRANPTN